MNFLGHAVKDFRTRGFATPKAQIGMTQRPRRNVVAANLWFCEEH